MQILLQAIWFVASPANAAASMFVLEPFGLREAIKKQGRSDVPNGLALQLC
jgi:hypothetical protein